MDWHVSRIAREPGLPSRPSQFSFASSRLGYLHSLLPTACAVGCILAPLRGWGGRCAARIRGRGRPRHTILCLAGHIVFFSPRLPAFCGALTLVKSTARFLAFSLQSPLRCLAAGGDQ